MLACSAFINTLGSIEMDRCIVSLLINGRQNIKVEWLA